MKYLTLKFHMSWHSNNITNYKWNQRNDWRRDNHKLSFLNPQLPMSIDSSTSIKQSQKKCAVKNDLHKINNVI